MTGKSHSARLPFILATLFVLTLAIFSETLLNGFVNWDDNLVILDDPLIRSVEPGALWEITTRVDPRLPVRAPLAEITHALNYRIFGFAPWGHHLSSVILHAINTCLIFFLFLILLQKARPEYADAPALLFACSVGALLFSLHPLRVEPVAWAAARDELLCAFFYFAALLVYLFYTSARSIPGRAALYLLTLFLFMLALTAKPMAVTLPVIVLLLDAYPLSRLYDQKTRFVLIFEKLPFFILSFLAGAMMIMAPEQKSGAQPLFELPRLGTLFDTIKNLIFFQQTSGESVSLGFTERFLNAIVSLWFYLQKTLWPISLSAYYPFPEKLTVLSGLFITSASILTGVTLACVWTWRKGQPIWLTIWLYYLITISPVLGLIYSSQNSAAADRYTYIPTLGFYLLIAFAGLRIWEKKVQSPVLNYVKVSLLTSTALILLVFSLLARQQILTWENGETLWEHVIRLFPGKLPLAHNQLGHYFMEEGMLEEAKKEFETTLRMDPQFTQGHNNLGLLYMNAKNLPAAEAAFQQALKISPRSAKAHNNLGLLYLQQARFDAAEEALLSALKSDPNYAKAYNNMGLLYLNQNKIDLAEEAFRSALRLNPDFVEALNNIGLVLLKREKTAQAVEAFEKALQQQPDFLPAFQNLMALHQKTPQ